MSLDRIKKHLPWMTLLALVLIVGIADPTFLKPRNLLSLAGDIVPLFIMAMGMTFAIYIGGIDLSAQNVANMTTVIATLALPFFGIWTALVCVLAGFSLGTARGLHHHADARAVLHHHAGHRGYRAVGQPVPVGSAGALHGRHAAQRDLRLDDRQHVRHPPRVAASPPSSCCSRSSSRPAPRSAASLKAVGAGEPAALASGLNTARYKMLAFAISGGLAAIAGLHVRGQAVGRVAQHGERVPPARHRRGAGGRHAIDRRRRGRGEHADRHADRGRDPRRPCSISRSTRPSSRWCSASS